MNKDVLIGAADLYEWHHIKPWALSIKESGFTGDIWLIAYRVNPDVIAICEANGINVYQVNHDQYLQSIRHAQQGSPTQAHNLRFFHAWELLKRLENPYRYVIMTDVRDVVFQRNPSEWLHNREDHLQREWFVAPSEAILYRDEEWGTDNMVKGHGPILYDMVAKDQLCVNVGTIAGTAKCMHSLFLMIYYMTVGRHYPADQSAFALIVHQLKPWMTVLADGKSAWAAQIGTTLDPTKAWLHSRNVEPQPQILNGLVYSVWGKTLADAEAEMYTIVHQWDRHPELKKVISERYGI